MISYSIIQKSQLEGANRLDAEYYQQEYLEKITRLKAHPVVNLRDIAYITDGEHGSPIWDENSGIKYFSAQNVREFYVDDANANTISKVIDQRNKRSRLQEGDVLLSTVGTIGMAGLVRKKLLPANIDRHVARISLKQNTLDSEFLVAFLNSSYGIFQTIRQATGNVQLNLFIEKIKELKVPKFNNSKVSKLVSTALQELDNSENYYQQAEGLLLEELGLKDFQIKDDLSFVVNLSDVQSAHRLDAEYFQPKYERLLQQIQSKNGKKLGDLVTMKKGFEPGSEAYQEEGKLFLRVSSISKFGIEDKDQKYLNNDLYQKLKGDFEPRAGEILLTKDATPGVAYVLKESIEGIISGGILTLKIKQSTDSEYLALCISSIVGQMQAERDAGGSIIAHWRPEQIRDILIPILPQSTQQKIANLVRQSHEARKKSKELLEEAKSRVEEMIEKGVQDGQN